MWIVIDIDSNDAIPFWRFLWHILFGLSDMSSFKSTPPQKLRVKAGHSVIFELPPVESVPTPSVTWQTEDNALLYGTKYAVTSDNRQIILSVDSSDQKRYR